MLPASRMVSIVPLLELIFYRQSHKDNVSIPPFPLRNYQTNKTLIEISDHFTAKLSVRMTSGPDFVTTNFTFFDCNTYSSCTRCVSSSFPCDWCVDGHRCTHDTAENCRNDILVTGVSVSIFFRP